MQRQKRFRPERVRLKRSGPILVAGLTVLIGALSLTGTDSRSLATGLDGDVSASAPQSGSQQEIWGDGDCSGSINPIDSLKLLRKDAGLSSLLVQGLCPGLGSSVAVNAVTRVWGDGDCSGALNPVDSLKTLRFDAGLSAPKVDPTCPNFGSAVTIGAAAGLTLLNEVLFVPVVGDDPFVELKTAGSGADPSGLLLVNERNDAFVIPSVGTIAAEEVLLLEFGGSDFLDDEAGFVELRDGDEVLDRVAWGDDWPDSVRLSRGGASGDPAPGMTVGRIPSSITPSRFDWVSYSAAQASPGRPNPVAGVEVLLPVDGGLFTTSDVSVAWYTVAGAEAYRVQVAGDDVFGSPIVDETVSAASLVLGSLANGEYFWRVKALNGEGTEFSAASRFTVAAGLSLPSSPNVEGAALDVPLIKQRKDTEMLHLLVEDQEGQHAWDVDHEDIDHDDPADNGNCALAALAMINGYYGGKLSQDRIGTYSNRAHPIVTPQPAFDLYYNNMTGFRHLRDLYEWAVGPVFYQEGPLPGEGILEGSWEFIVDAIDGSVPLIAAIPGHAFVIKGYALIDGVRHIVINDPSLGEHAIEFRDDLVVALWSPDPEAGPVEAWSDEGEGVYDDADGDGLVDFDETVRFRTDPNKADTDGDGVPDKTEIEFSLFAPGLDEFGPHGQGPGRDWDNDDIPMELDCDSDNDGIKDGADADNFPWPLSQVPQDPDCGTPDAYIGSTRMLQTGGGRMNVAVAQDILFVRQPGDPNGFESVSGTLTYSVSGPFGIVGCEMTGSITVPIEPGDADFDFLTGVGLPSLMTGTGSTPGLQVPATVTCLDETTFEVMAGTQIWFWPQENYTNLNHLKGEFTPSFGDGNTTYTWDLYGAAAPP